ncbi:2-hydroxy-3-oxopropionate reductase, partial [Alcaligenes faecalis subsp. faecalis NCIB 8687]
MVPDTPHVEDALFGENGVAAGLSAGKIVVELLKYAASGFVYSVGISPVLAAASLQALQIMRQGQEDKARAIVQKLAPEMEVSKQTVLTLNEPKKAGVPMLDLLKDGGKHECGAGLSIGIKRRQIGWIRCTDDHGFFRAVRDEPVPQFQAAMSGQGIALVSRLMVEDELKNGQLIAPQGFIPDGSLGYKWSKGQHLGLT